MTDTHTGNFYWYELLTSDPKAALAFYADVVGWTTQPFEGHDYTMVVTAQGPIGGATVLPDVAKAAGARPYWQANVFVEDVDATVAKVKELGGQVYVVETVPTVGRLAVIADPQGAVLAVFHPETDNGCHAINQPGEFSWHELYTTDHKAAFEFYRQIAGWEHLGAVDLGPIGEYLLWGKNGQPLGGMMTTPPGMKTPDGGAVPPSWMYYLSVEDLDAALERAKAGKATVLNGPMEVPGGQRVVQLLDPQGAAFALTTIPK